jgi:uncharacterized alkaline shock family protein YloU
MAQSEATVKSDVTTSNGTVVRPDHSTELDALHTEHGDTAIAEGVVAKIAGMATREVPGVYAMGNVARRAVNALAQRIPGGQTNVTGGVSVEKGERQTVIDIAIVLDYGQSAIDVSQQIRESVITAVEYGTGLDVVAVNINITDVHLPDDEEDDVTDTQDLA